MCVFRFQSSSVHALRIFTFALSAQALQLPSIMTMSVAGLSAHAAPFVPLVGEQAETHDISGEEPRSVDCDAARSYCIADGSRGHGLRAVFGRFMAEADTIEFVDPYLTSALDVFAEFIRLFSESPMRALSVLSPAIVGKRILLDDSCWRWLIERPALASPSKCIFLGLPWSIHDRRLHFLGSEHTWVVGLGRGLGMYYPARGPEESVFDLRRAKGCFVDTTRLRRRVSLMTELRIDSAFAAASGSEAWQREAGAPRALRRALRRARHYEKLVETGADIGPDRRRLLRRRPRLQAALAASTHPAAGVCLEHPPRAALQRVDLEADLMQFRRRTARELTELIDFHLKPQDESTQFEDRRHLEQDPFIKDVLAGVERKWGKTLGTVEVTLKTAVGHVIEDKVRENTTSVRQIQSALMQVAKAVSEPSWASELLGEQQRFQPMLGRCESMLLNGWRDSGPHCRPASSTSPVCESAEGSLADGDEFYDCFEGKDDVAAPAARIGDAVKSGCARRPGPPGAEPSKSESLDAGDRDREIFELLRRIRSSGRPIPPRPRTHSMTKTAFSRVADQYLDILRRIAAEGSDGHPIACAAPVAISRAEMTNNETVGGHDRWGDCVATVTGGPKQNEKEENRSTGG